MKFIFLLLTLLNGGSAALADTQTVTPFSNAQVIPINITCTQDSSGLYARLKVDLAISGKAFDIQDSFYSESVRGSDGLISSMTCDNIRNDLTPHIGKPILLDGQVLKRTYETQEDIVGTCRRGHPMIGFDYYPCVKGHHTVTKTDRTIFLVIDGVRISNRRH